MSKTRGPPTFLAGKKIAYCREMGYQKPINSESVVTFSHWFLYASVCRHIGIYIMCCYYVS